MKQKKVGKQCKSTPVNTKSKNATGEKFNEYSPRNGKQLSDLTRNELRGLTGLVQFYLQRTF